MTEFLSELPGLTSVPEEATGAAGSRQVSWDGRDQGGRALPEGIYCIRLSTAGGRRAERVTMIR